jgi:hypothetical protein
MHQMLDAALDLRDAMSQLDALDDYRQWHLSGVAYTIIQALLLQLAEGYLPLPNLRALRSAEGITDAEQWRVQAAEFIRSSPGLWADEDRELISDALLKLNDGSRVPPPILTPTIIRKNSARPKDADALRFTLCEWIEWEIGRGSVAAAVEEFVSKLPGSRGVKSIQGWRRHYKKDAQWLEVLRNAKQRGKQGHPFRQGAFSIEQVVAEFGEAATPRGESLRRAKSQRSRSKK